MASVRCTVSGRELDVADCGDGDIALEVDGVAVFVPRGELLAALGEPSGLRLLAGRVHAIFAALRMGHQPH